MNRVVVTTLLLLSSVCWARGVRADEASHAAATHELFKVMHMDEMMAKSIESMLDQQVRANPAIARYRAVMSTFVQKYMSFSSIEPEMTKIYMQEFNEDEIKKITDFYRTPLGQKVITRTPAMVAKGASLGQSRVQQHMAELQKMISDEDARLRGLNATPPAGPPPAPAPAPHAPARPPSP